MSKLLNQLKADHSNIFKLLCILENQIQSLQDGNKTEEPMHIIREILDYMQQYPSICHHPREELLIDMLVELLSDSDQTSLDNINKLKGQQNSIELLTPELYQQVHFAVESSYVGMIEQIKIFLDYYYKHVELEESFLFPLALQLFTDEDWQEMDGHFSDSRDPLFSRHEETENHFIYLHQMIIEYDKGLATKTA